MKSDWQTVTENRQIQQSVTLLFDCLRDDDAAATFSRAEGTDAGPGERALSCLRALVLCTVSTLGPEGRHFPHT